MKPIQNDPLIHHHQLPEPWLKQTLVGGRIMAQLVNVLPDNVVIEIVIKCCISLLLSRLGMSVSETEQPRVIACEVE